MHYEELRNIQQKENVFRKYLGVKANKKRISNLDHRFIPQVDPRVLRAALKQKDAYYGEGKLNMIEVVGTNTLKQRALDEAEREGKEVPKEDLKKFETESIVQMQDKAKLAMKTSIGNPKLAQRGVPNVPIKECTFQPEQRIVRYPTDTVGDKDKKKFQDKNENVTRRADLMTAHKMTVLKRKVVERDESEKIFEDFEFKKGKERELYRARAKQPEKSPEKLENQKPQKTYQVKEYQELQATAMSKARIEIGLKASVDYVYP